MVCSVAFSEKPKLNDPILIEGLPGIGFIANIASCHLINNLISKKFAEILSSSFQDFAILTKGGGTLSPLNELYYVKRKEGKRDLIIWYGNTQALTTKGQYELCGKILDIAQGLGCRFTISLGGFKKEEATNSPTLYLAASSNSVLKETLCLGAKTMIGHIFGIAGLMVGLSKLRNIESFALLVDTQGTNPDILATKVALIALKKYLELDMDISNLDFAANETKRLLEPLGLIRNIRNEKKKEEDALRWYI